MKIFLKIKWVKRFSFPKPSLGPKHKVHWLLVHLKKRAIKKYGRESYLCDKPITTFRFTKNPDMVDCTLCLKKMTEPKCQDPI